nr:uncharacterized protein LOC128696930 [Cherax quadricarinatus]
MLVVPQVRRAAGTQGLQHHSPRCITTRTRPTDSVVRVSAPTVFLPQEAHLKTQNEGRMLFHLQDSDLAELFSELVDSGGSPTVSGDVIGYCYTLVESLKTWLQGRHWDVLSLYNSDLPDDRYKMPHCSVGGGTASSRVVVFAGLGDIFLGDEQFDCLVFVKGSSACLTAVAQAVERIVGTKCFYPPDLWQFSEWHLRQEYSVTLASIQADVCVVGPSADINELLTIESVPWYVKTLSVLYLLFPWIHKMLNKEVILIRLSVYSAVMGFTRLTLPPVSEMKGSNDFIISTAVYALAPSWSRTELLAEHIYKRICAALSQSGTVIKLDEVKRILAAINWPREATNSRVDEVIGQVLAINKQGHFDLKTERVDLIPIDELEVEFHLSRWSASLLEQMRMVYINFRGKTVRFGVAVREAARTHLEGLHEAFTRELSSIDQIADDVSRYPYLSCRYTIPTQYRISTFPRICYLGLLYFMKNLETEKEKKTFEQYNISRVAEAITSQGDRKLVESLAQVLPTEILYLTAQLVAMCSEKQGDIIASSMDDAEVEALLDLLKQKPQPGPWYLAKIHARNVAQAKSTELLKVRAQEGVGEQKNDRRAGNLVETTQTMSKRVNRGSQNHNTMTTLTDKLTNMRDTAPMTDTPDERLVRHEILYARSVCYMAHNEPILPP